MTVVKADAYGHGLKHVAALLMQSGTDVFGVANLSEAGAIRRVGSGWPILMLGACLPHEVEFAVRDQVMPTISTLGEAVAFSKAAAEAGKTVDVHVKVDTGMGRLGAAPSEVMSLLEEVRRLPGLRLDGIYTHLSSAEDDPEFTAKQIVDFREVLAQIESAGIRIPWVHVCNSAGLLHEPEAIFNMVRPGLLVYGVWPRGKRPFDEEDVPIAPALSFHCRVALIKEVRKGTPLGYGHAYIAPRNMRVATVTAGYGDGYMRAASKKAEVLVRGSRCRVLGRISMDQMLVDVSFVESAEVGDEVILIGRQERDRITVNELAEWCGTIPWEVLTNITYRVPRLYRGSQAA